VLGSRSNDDDGSKFHSQTFERAKNLVFLSVKLSHCRLKNFLSYLKHEKSRKEAIKDDKLLAQSQLLNDFCDVPRRKKRAANFSIQIKLD
jgi:hypothetical protein